MDNITVIIGTYEDKWKKLLQPLIPNGFNIKLNDP